MKINHCFSERNQCADRMVRLGATQQQDFITFDDPLSDLSLLLYFDAVGGISERLCANPSVIFL